MQGRADDLNLALALSASMVSNSASNDPVENMDHSERCKRDIHQFLIVTFHSDHTLELVSVIILKTS